MFAIVNEIEDNSHKSMLSVVVTSISSSAGIYLLVAITGYLSFGDHIGGNIIAQYSSTLASTVGCAAIVILVMFSYPLQLHPCRGSVDNVLKWRPRRVHSVAIAGRAVEMSDIKFAVISTILIVGTYITAMSVGNLETVLAYVGSTGSTAISLCVVPTPPHPFFLLADVCPLSVSCQACSTGRYRAPTPTTDTSSRCTTKRTIPKRPRSTRPGARRCCGGALWASRATACLS